MKKSAISIICLLISALFNYGHAEILNTVVDEIIKECVSLTNGYITHEEVTDTKDRITQIALPVNLQVFDIPTMLKSLTNEIEQFYFPTTSWKTIEGDGYLCCFYVTKDEPQRSLGFVFDQKNHFLQIHDSPSNSLNISLPTSTKEQFEKTTIWEVVNLLGGFITAETKENVSSEYSLYKILVQLPDAIAYETLIWKMKPIYSSLEHHDFTVKAWSYYEDKGIQCEFFTHFDDNESVLTNFFYIPNGNGIVITFVSDVDFES